MGVLSPADAAALQAKGLINAETAAAFGPPPVAPAAVSSGAGFMGALANAGLGAKLDPSGAIPTQQRLLSPEESDAALANMNTSAPAFSVSPSGPLSQSAANAAIAGAPPPAPAAPPPPPAPAAPAPAAPMPAAARGTPNGGGGVAAKDPRLVGFEKEKQINADEQRRLDQDRVNAVDAAERDANAREAYQVRSQALQLEQENKRAAEAADIDKQVATTRASIDEYKNSKVDKNKYFKDAGFLGTALGVIGAAIGGGLAARTGGPNQALGFIEREIEKDIRLQEAAIDRKGKNISMQQSLLGDMRAQTQNNEAARNAARVLMYQNLQDEIATQAAKNKAPEVQSKYAEMANGLKKLEVQADTALQTTLKRERAAAAVAAQARQDRLKQQGFDNDIKVAGVRIDAQKAQNEADQKGTLNVAVEGLTKADGTPLEVKARSPKDAEELRAGGIAVAGIRQNLAEIKRMREEYGGEAFPTEAAKRMQSLSTQTMMQLKEAQKLGVLAGPDLDLLSRQLPMDPSARFTTDGNIFAQIDELDKGVVRNYQNTLNQRSRGAPAISPEARAAAISFRERGK